MCTLHHMTFDGHDYTLRVDAQSRTTTIHTADNEILGTVETSPCGEYFLATPTNNPLGLGWQQHIGTTTLEEVACTIITGDY